MNSLEELYEEVVRLKGLNPDTYVWHRPKCVLGPTYMQYYLTSKKTGKPVQKGISFINRLREVITHNNVVIHPVYFSGNRIADSGNIWHQDSRYTTRTQQYRCIWDPASGLFKEFTRPDVHGPSPREITDKLNVVPNATYRYMIVSQMRRDIYSGNTTREMIDELKSVITSSVDAFRAVMPEMEDISGCHINAAFVSGDGAHAHIVYPIWRAEPFRVEGHKMLRRTITL